jgi:hypothetical protein
MSGFYDDASWVLIPEGIKEDVVYAQKPTDGLGDLTFTRASDATRTNSAGVIEKVRTNQVLQSNSFDTTWVNVDTTETSGQAGYDGTNNAWLLDIASGLTTQRIQQTISASGSLTLSVYAKAGTKNWTRLFCTGTIISANAYFNLQTGALGAAVNCTSKIEAAGNGYYRCSISLNTTITAARIYVATDDGNVTQSSGNILIQNAQLEVGDIATDYIPTTTAAVSVGPVSGLPRLDYLNSSCPRLLLEPQRTNLALYSEQFDNAAYIKNNVSVTANTSVSPDGYTNADTILSTAASPQLRSPAVTFGAATNVSIFVKYVSQQFVQLFGGAAFGDFANFDIQNATLGTSGASTANAKIENYGNGWLRISATFSGFVGNTTARIGFTASSSAGWNILDTAFSKSVLAYGFQAEVGAYATTYIPTTTAAVTRVTDAFSRSNIYTNGFISDAGGTWFVDLTGNIQYARDAASGLAINEGTNQISGNGFTILLNSANLARLAVRKYVGNVSTVMFVTTTDNVKLAIKWNGTTADLFLNGSKVVSDTSFTSTELQNLLGSAGLPILVNQSALFPTPLTDDQCIEITTL